MPNSESHTRNYNKRGRPKMNNNNMRKSSTYQNNGDSHYLFNGQPGEYQKYVSYVNNLQEHLSCFTQECYKNGRYHAVRYFQSTRH